MLEESKLEDMLLQEEELYVVEIYYGQFLIPGQRSSNLCTAYRRYMLQEIIYT